MAPLIHTVFYLLQENHLSLPKTRSLIAALVLSLAGASFTVLPAAAQSITQSTKASAKSAQASAALALPAGVTLGPSAEGITEYRFANGFKLLMLPDNSQPTVTTNLVYLVGSRHENYGETGMAHLLEHLLFKGTPRHSAIPQEFSQRGMRFNASTWIDTTNYHETFQASDDNLRWAIGMEADRMLNSKIAKKDLDSEMTVVRNEFEQGENSPFGVLLKRMQSVAYDWHSYGRSTIGNRSDIENVKIENLQAFYKTYYQPDNAVLVIAGQFDPAKALQWVNQSFGKMAKPRRKLPVFWTVEPTQDGERQFLIRRSGDVQMVSVAYKVPSELHADRNALGIAGAILSDSATGRLHKSLVETGLAAEVGQFYLGGIAPGLQMITATVKAGADIEPVKQALIAGIESFASTPPTQEELERVKRAQANGSEKTQSNAPAMAMALGDSIALGDWRQLFASRDALARISADEVAAVAAKYYRRDNRTVGLFVPEEHPQRTEVPAAPPMKDVLAGYTPRADVAAGETFDASPANIAQRTRVLQPNQGQQTALKIALLPKKTRGGLVTVRLNLDFGDEKSLAGKQALVRITNLMLSRGTESKTREQLSDASQRLKMNGDLFFYQTTRENLAASVQLVAEAARHPRFDAAEFEQLRKELLVALEASRGDPESRANEALFRHFNTHPAGDWRNTQTLDEQIAQVKSVTLEQVRQFHRDFYGASNGELAIVGDFDADAALKAINASFGNWVSPAPYQRILQTWSDIAPMHQVVNMPDKENGVFVARQNIQLRDTDDDYAAMQVANYLIGASSKTRLHDRLREKDGLSYTVVSTLNAGDYSDAGNLLVMAIAAPQNLDKVETGVREELARLLKDGFTVEELERAKSGMLALRRQTRANDAALVSQWLTLLDRDLSPAWMARQDERIASLTLEQLNAALRKHLDPARLSVVIARDEVRAKAVAAK